MSKFQINQTDFHVLLQEKVAEVIDEPAYNWNSAFKSFMTDNQDQPVIRIGIINFDLDMDIWAGLGSPAMVDMYPVTPEDIWRHYACLSSKTVRADGSPNPRAIPEPYEEAKARYRHGVIVCGMLAVNPEMYRLYAEKVAQEMEELCPHAWMLNLTNPMTTICRGVTRTTSIKTIGLCHEVDIFRNKYLVPLLNVSAEDITFDVAEINHLPAILRLRVNGQDGFLLLQEWLGNHDMFEFTDQHIPGPENVFNDRLAVKLFLFKKLGVLFGSGDRHIAEFFPGFLDNDNHRGERYGVVLTTIDHRENLAHQDRREYEQFVNGSDINLSPTNEQVVPVMAALSGGPTGQFIVNIPNVGQIDNLPRDAVVECRAHIDQTGVHPFSVGRLQCSAHEAIAPHVARQELIVEAALTGEREHAVAALSSDPLITDQSVVNSLLDDLLASRSTVVMI